jgi:hypothetical protein
VEKHPIVNLKRFKRWKFTNRSANVFLGFGPFWFTYSNIQSWLDRWCRLLLIPGSIATAILMPIVICSGVPQGYMVGLSCDFLSFYSPCVIITWRPDTGVEEHMFFGLNSWEWIAVVILATTLSLSTLSKVEYWRRCCFYRNDVNLEGFSLIALPFITRFSQELNLVSHLTEANWKCNGECKCRKLVVKALHR